ncbi:unnamed protein product [Ceutorhynchus assimilis]|uniref:Origin recognition complex subunit 6 n=1 Tax=Ceutorhynchus assimilis TaxID=467358 RepID=A0A9N9MKF8_9CUCU|nr:unnamed protein product [Ceutorhynchus assimilis]
MDKHLLKSTAQKLNVHDETVLKKTEEFVRLYQSKGSIKTLNLQATTILCLDLACLSLGNGFDKEAALILSGLKKSAYQNNLNNIEKILGLDKPISITDICVKLGCTVIKEDAEKILTRYQKLDNKIKDLEHPQYVAAATFVACKAKKVSIDKSKIVTLSRLKPSQWKELISMFESLGLGKTSPRKKTKGPSAKDDEIVAEIECQEITKDEVEEVEDYEVWKKRILEEAYKHTNENMEE